MRIKNRFFLSRKEFFPSQGFTLIELLLVVLLIAVLAALAVPNFSKSYRRVQLKTDAQNLSVSMMYAMNRSLARNQHIYLVFDEDFQAYQLQEVNADSSQMRPLTGRYGSKIRFSTGTEVSVELPVIHFLPDGSVDKIHIELCDSKKCFIVSTKEQRGLVRIFEPAGKSP